MDDKIEKQGTWCVYIHTNKINNQAYIGITSQNPQDRWGKNGTGYYYNSALRNAINKYGWENFEHIIFANDLTKEEAVHAEKTLVALFKTNRKRFYNPAYGYNLTDGGDEPPHPVKPVYQYSLDGAYIKSWDSIVEAAQQVRTNTTSIILCCQDKKKSSGGFLWSYDKHNELHQYNNLREKVPIVQYDKQGAYINKFASLSEAASSTGVSVGAICQCYKHEKRSAGGFVWRLEGDADIEYINNMGNNRKAVLQLDMNGDLIKRFQSIAEAAKSVGLKTGTGIRNCCNNKGAQSGGYKWQWEVDVE